MRPNACSLVTAAPIWKKFSWMWPAGAHAKARQSQRNDRGRLSDGPIVLAHRRNGASLLVSLAFVLAARARPDLLADRADADVGFPADVRRAKCRLLCPRRRRVHRLRAVVGYPVPRATRLLDLIFGGDVRPQSRQHHDVAAASGRVRPC